MELTITIKVTDARVAGLLCTGFEGGMTGQWCRVMKTVRPKGPGPVPRVLDEGREDGKSWPIYDFALCGGRVVCRLDGVDSGDTDRKYAPLVLDRAAIDRGLAVMAAKFPRHLADFLGENDDAITGDVFIQCCLLGDVVYG